MVNFLTNTPPLPVIIDAMGFKRVYARDYQAGALPVDDGLVEPWELEFALLLKQQEANRQTAVSRPQAAAGGGGN
jgi:hypothetical protein